MRTYVAFIVVAISLAIAKPLPQNPLDQATQDAQTVPVTIDEIAASLSPGSGSIFADWTTGGYQTTSGDQPPAPVDPATVSLGNQPPVPVDPVTGDQSAVSVNSAAAAISDAAGLNTLVPNTLLADAKVAKYTPYEYIYDKSQTGYLADAYWMPVPKCPHNYDGTCCYNGDALADSRDGAFTNALCKDKDNWRCCRDKTETGGCQASGNYATATFTKYLARDKYLCCGAAQMD